MTTTVRKPVAPFYAVAAVWLVCGLFLILRICVIAVKKHLILRLARHQREKGREHHKQNSKSHLLLHFKEFLCIQSCTAA